MIAGARSSVKELGQLKDSFEHERCWKEVIMM